MNDIKRFSLILLLFVFFADIHAQKDRNYSAAQLKNLARSAERMNDPESATLYYEKYLEKKPSDIGTIYILAENYRRIGAFEKAKENYKLVFTAKKKKYPLSAFYLAEMISATDNCEDALALYNDFRKDYRGEKEDRKYIRLAKFAIQGCEAGKIDTHIVSKIIVKKLPQEINGEHIQGAPIFLENGDLVYNSLNTNGQEKFDIESDEIPKRQFYIATSAEDNFKLKGLWELTKDFKEKEIANGAFNADRSRFYFSACEEDDFGKVNCDIYRMENKSGKWTAPKPLGDVVNTRFTESQVAVGLDEKERETVYFVSNRKGGKGGMDIWYTTYYEKKDSYKTPRNCGSKVNSVGDEITPFINPLNRKLIFSSDGHPGYGGFDVFKSAGQRSRWSEPENMGKEINGRADELYYILKPTGGEGVFASNRMEKGKAPKGYCCDDLYFFKELNRIKISLKGMVRTINPKGKEQIVKLAKVKVYQLDPNSNETFLVQSKSVNEDGSFEFQLEPDQEYVVKAEGDGFLTDEKSIKTKGIINDQDLTLNYELEAYKDKTIELENVYFKFNKAELREDSKAIIDEKLVKVLKNNPEIIIEVGSHTDSKGTEAYNRNLSQKRAEMVIKYLRGKGISKNRLVPKGYGESKPVAPNKNEDGSDNPEGRKQNRRTEFRVIGKLDLSEEEDFD